MSHDEENESLLANMAGDPETDENLFADMQAMMGFSSFGGTQKPKRQPKVPGPGRGFGTGANSQPVKPRNPPTSTTKSTPRLSASSQPFVPASLPPRPPKPASNLPSDLNSDTINLQPISPSSTTAASSTTLTATIGITNNNAHDSSTPTSTLTSHHTSTQAGPGTSTPLAQTLQSGPDTTTAAAYTNPETGYTLTKHDLSIYERGVDEIRLDNNGKETQIKVYFKPNFIDGNPWRDLEVAAAARIERAGSLKV